MDHFRVADEGGQGPPGPFVLSGNRDSFRDGSGQDERVRVPGHEARTTFFSNGAAHVAAGSKDSHGGNSVPSGWMAA